MSTPSVYLFSIEDEFKTRIAAIVSMSEEEALEKMEEKYSKHDHNIYLLKSIDIRVTTNEVIELWEE